MGNSCIKNEIIREKSVLVGMSGGVDSSVAAMRLQSMGYNVEGATLRLFAKSNDISPDVIDAVSVCDKLSIKHHVCDFFEDFNNIVISDFIEAYQKGETPNPCITCNRHIKFDKMWEQAQKLGISYIATGHYANIEYDASLNRFLLKKAKDINKDQTYMLYSLTQEQLSHTLFPLGDLQKPQIRKIAEENSLITAHKRDSQDICFVPNGDYATFIRQHATRCICDEPGDFIDETGGFLGRHNGVIHYTIGQRKGLNLSFDSPRYVVKKDAQNNTVTLGKEDSLYTLRLTAHDSNFISIEKLVAPMRVKAKTRYSQLESNATISPVSAGESGDIEVVFDEPQRAITKGQAVVFYDGDIVLGGGTIG